MKLIGKIRRKKKERKKIYDEKIFCEKEKNRN